MTQILEEPGGRAQLAENHGTGFHPQFVLRTGYIATYPDPVSLRRPVEWFVRSEQG